MLTPAIRGQRSYFQQGDMSTTCRINFGSTMPEPTISLWVFPESDFEAWCELVQTPQVDSYQEYMALITAAQADQERNGLTVERVHLTVTGMMARLRKHGLRNTPDGRASALVLGD